MAIPRISQLDEMTIGHIAAGEVVERPAQVVKELLENSLDAKATKIEIEIQKGGFDSLEVRDNGHGILSGDLAKAVDRHATSKLHSHTDLAEIHTLGFAVRLWLVSAWSASCHCRAGPREKRVHASP